MEKKYFEEFLHIFRLIKYAASRIPEDFQCPCMKQRTIQGTDEIEKLIDQFAKWDYVFFKNIFDEIEQNLYNHSDSREIYLTKILKDFLHIAPYLNIDVVSEYCSYYGMNGVKINNIIYPFSLVIMHQTLKWRQAWDIPDFHVMSITIPEKYAILCYRAFNIFFGRLDIMSTDFDLDLMEIQNKKNIQVWVRCYPPLNGLSYSDLKQPKELGDGLEIKPIFNHEALPLILEILEDFFSTEDQKVLVEILGTLNNAKKKLTFLGNGNRLTDTFKKLIENDKITGWQKIDLENWMILNFNYVHRKKVTKYTHFTIKKTMSRNDNPCKNPLIEIVNGQILKVN